MSSPTLTKPIFEHHPDGFAIGNSRPRISWRFEAREHTIPAWTQSAYEVEVESLPSRQINTYRVESSCNILNPWPCSALQSRQRAKIRVRCYGRSKDPSFAGCLDSPTAWSPAAEIEVGLLDPSDFTASFITSSQRFGPKFPVQPIRFRKEFMLPTREAPERARLYITSLGVFEVCINGQVVSNECMAPGWTSYKHRLYYRAFEVGKYIDQGKPNVLTVEVGEGWYAGKLGFRGGTRFLYGGTELAILSQLEIDFCSSGKYRHTIASDETWSCAPSSIQSSEIYNGEICDMRREHPGWKTADFDTKSFSSTKTLVWPSGLELVAPSGPPVRVIESIRPVAILQSDSGNTILDFGQNLVGKLLVDSLHLPEGAHLIFRHAEVLENGELGTRPLCDAKCEDIVISSGEKLYNWTPKFTFHGFRYAEVKGWPGDNESLKSSVSALIVHSDLRRRGHFSCSNSSVNQLHENVVWSMRGNFLSVPTDCPQRDERLGWTGDIAIFAPSASYLYDTIGFLEEWLQDLAAEQLEEGRHGVPGLVCPDVPLKDWPRIPQAIWHDVTVLLPNVLHTFSNDKAILRRQFQSMRSWLEHGVDRGSDGLWNLYRWQLGDWLDPTAPPQQPAMSRTDSCLVADAYLVHVTATFAHICHLLEEAELASKYTSDAASLKALFQSKYITPLGNLMSNTQTSLALAIRFQLYSSHSQLAVASEQLSKLVRSARFHIATGFAGTPDITHALTATGHSQLAYRMLLEQKCPSWIYPITMGATTVWERWDSMLPDGSINPGRMTSFNHYALGAVANWLHSSVGGISPASAGWRTVRVRPVPGGNLTWAEVSFDGPCGLVRCKWWTEPTPKGQLFKMDLSIPPNSNAIVTLPNEWKTDVTEEVEPSRIVASGDHHFECVFEAGEWPPKALLPPNITYAQEMDNVAE